MQVIRANKQHTGGIHTKCFYPLNLQDVIKQSVQYLDEGNKGNKEIKNVTPKVVLTVSTTKGV